MNDEMAPMRLWTQLNTVRGFVLCFILAFVLVAGAVHVARASADPVPPSPPGEHWVYITITFNGDEWWVMGDMDHPEDVEIWEFHEGDVISFWYNTGTSGWVKLSGDAPQHKTRAIIGAANG